MSTTREGAIDMSMEDSVIIEKIKSTTYSDGVINPATQDQLRTWVTALRSGDYQQGQFSLRSGWEGENTSYCCLGVAKEVMPEIVPDGFDDIATGTLVAITTDEDAPSTHQLYFLDRKTQQKLTRMNDVEGFTFNGIATWIEDNLIEKGAAS